jgi:hypothetical protein
MKIIYLKVQHLKNSFHWIKGLESLNIFQYLLVFQTILTNEHFIKKLNPYSFIMDFYRAFSNPLKIQYVMTIQNLFMKST